MVRPLDVPSGKIPLAVEVDRIWGGARQNQGAEAAAEENLTGSIC